MKEWFGEKLFSIIEGSVYVVRGIYRIRCFSERWNWTQHRFYNNKFCRDKSSEMDAWEVVAGL